MRKLSMTPRRMVPWASALLLPAAAHAGTVEIPLSGSTVITSGEGLARVLVKPVDLNSIRGKLVVSAYLEFDLPGATLPADLDVEVYALSRDWEGGTATWSYPWERPGGDVDGEFFFTRHLEAGRPVTGLKLDVSAIARAMAEGEKGEYGFVLSVPWGRADGFRIQDLNRLGGLASGTLSVHYRVTTPRSAGQGARKGASTGGLSPGRR